MGFNKYGGFSKSTIRQSNRIANKVTKGLIGGVFLIGKELLKTPPSSTIYAPIVPIKTSSISKTIVENFTNNETLISIENIKATIEKYDNLINENLELLKMWESKYNQFLKSKSLAIKETKPIKLPREVSKSMAAYKLQLLIFDYIIVMAKINEKIQRIIIKTIKLDYSDATRQEICKTENQIKLFNVRINRYKEEDFKSLFNL